MLKLYFILNLSFPVSCGPQLLLSFPLNKPIVSSTTLSLLSQVITLSCSNFYSHSITENPERCSLGPQGNKTACKPVEKDGKKFPWQQDNKGAILASWDLMLSGVRGLARKGMTNFSNYVSQQDEKKTHRL